MRVKSVGPNMTEIILAEGRTRILVSYETPVACIIGGTAYKTRQFFSKTTSRHINKWLEGRVVAEENQKFFENLLENTSC